MNDNQDDKDLFERFFLEEQIGTLFGPQQEAEVQLTQENHVPLSPRRKIMMPHSDPAPENETKEFWRNLRSFFRRGKSVKPIADNFIPAILAPFTEQHVPQHSYPLWVPERSEEGLAAMPLQALFEKTVKNPEDNNSVLGDQLLRLTQMIESHLTSGEAKIDKLAPLIQMGLDKLVKSLRIKGEEGQKFKLEIEEFRQSLPDHGVVVPYSDKAIFLILNQIFENRQQLSRQKLAERIRPLFDGIRDILAVEKLKSAESTSAEKLHESLEFADEFVSFEKLSSLIPHDTENRMPDDRLSRLERVAEILGSGDEILGSSACILSPPNLAKSTAVNLRSIYRNGRFLDYDADHPAKVYGHFDEVIRPVIMMVAAIRIAELELTNRYVAGVHGDYFARFDWLSFTNEEWQYCTPFIVLAEDESFYRTLETFSQLLSGGRPVIYICLKSIGQQQIQELSSNAFRRELGALAIAHRNTYVLQASDVSPVDIWSGILQGLQSPAPLFFHLLSQGIHRTDAHISFLRISAAVEGREHPGFLFDNSGSKRWGHRFSIISNPEYESDWPLHEMEIWKDGGERERLEIPFTYADFSSLLASKRDYFMEVPAKYWTDDLILLADYLKLSEQETQSKIPFIWMVDKDLKLAKVSLSWPMVNSSRERLDYWHFLQENAGVHSYHVERATEQLRGELEELHKKEINELNLQHQLELEKVRREATRASMENLASILLDLDTASSLAEAMVQEISPPARPDVKEEKEETTSGKTEKKQPEEKKPAAPVLEAYIDTPLCTSCNECTDLNNRMFAYDQNKQAFIKDASAGPFSDLVKAAEVCPVHIIHPGSPLNPSEEGLEEWMKRAEPYN